MAPAKAKKTKTRRPGHTRLIDNPLFDTTFKRSSHHKTPAARSAKPKKAPGDGKLMSKTLFSSASRPSGHAVKSIKSKTRASVKAVVSRLKKVRKAHHALLKKMKLHKSPRRTTAPVMAPRRIPVRQSVKIPKNSLNTFFYRLGATLGSSKALFEQQKVK